MGESMGNHTKKQHYVWRGYLKRWTRIMIGLGACIHIGSIQWGISLNMNTQGWIK